MTKSRGVDGLRGSEAGAGTRFMYDRGFRGLKAGGEGGGPRRFHDTPAPGAWRAAHPRPHNHGAARVALKPMPVERLA
jgi:hypothetical protein